MNKTLSMALKNSPSSGRERKKTPQGDENFQRVHVGALGTHSRGS